MSCFPKSAPRSVLPKSEAVSVAPPRKQPSHPNLKGQRAAQRAAQVPKPRGTVVTVLQPPTEPQAKAIAVHCSTKQLKRVPEDVPGSNKRQKRVLEDVSQSADGKRCPVETKKKNLSGPFDVKNNDKVYKVPRDTSQVPQKKQPQASPAHSGKAKKQQQQRQALQAAGMVKEAAAPVTVEIQNFNLKMQQEQQKKMQDCMMDKMIERKRSDLEMQQQQLKKQQQDLNDLEIFVICRLHHPHLFQRRTTHPHLLLASAQHQG